MDVHTYRPGRPFTSLSNTYLHQRQPLVTLISFPECTRAAQSQPCTARAGRGRFCPAHTRRGLLQGGSGLLLTSLSPPWSTSPPAAAASFEVEKPPQIILARPSVKGEPPPTFVQATGRIIAIGDIHGDLQKAIKCLEVVGVLDEVEGRPVWVGGDATVVQLGDVLDRGDKEIAVVMLLRELDRQARREGGAVYMLNGNHESLNVAGDFRYVTKGAMIESAMAGGFKGELARELENQRRARLRLYCPGGRMARELAKNPTVLVVNDTVFAHGGLLPQHVRFGLERLNSEVASWMRGERLDDGSQALPPFLAMGDKFSVMWNRTLGKEVLGGHLDHFRACHQLHQTLELLGCSRLVIGHTPQLGGANCECAGRVWRVDVGMSSGVLNAEPQALEIEQDMRGETVVRVISGYPGAQCQQQAPSATAETLVNDREIITSITTEL